MTRGRAGKLHPEFLEADSVEDAIGKLRALKEALQGPSSKRGRPPKTEASPPTGSGVSRLTAHRPLGLLEVQQPADLDALLADPRLSPLIAMRLDERFALVLPASLERLQAALLKAGHTPKLLQGKEAGREEAGAQEE